MSLTGKRERERGKREREGKEREERTEERGKRMWREGERKLHCMMQILIILRSVSPPYTPPRPDDLRFKGRICSEKV